MKSRHNGARIALALAMAGALYGCSLTGGTLGGREKCWPASDARAATLWRGVLEIDTGGGRLRTPEGDVIVLLPGALAPRVTERRVGELVRGSDVLAREGDDVTLFGGIAGDGTMVVCGLEKINAPER